MASNFKTANDFKGGPWLGGWFIAAGIGAAAFGVCWIVGRFDLTSSVAIGGVLFLVAGIVLARLGSPRAMSPEATAVAQVAESAPAMSVPVTHASTAQPPSMPAAAATPPMAAPVLTAPVAAPIAGRKPEALTAARGGKADDLKIIKGIGPKLEMLCHRLGFFHFDQIANWTAEEIAWVDDNLEGFKGRVTRDRWVPQAKAIVSLGPQEFLSQLDAGKEF
jgi:NADH-quinone oxidoreductase subunit E